MSDQQFEDLMIVAGTLGGIGLCLAAGVYLVVTEHYGWAWIPFLYAGCVGYKRSPKAPTKDESLIIREET